MPRRDAPGRVIAPGIGRGQGLGRTRVIPAERVVVPRVNRPPGPVRPRPPIVGERPPAVSRPPVVSRPPGRPVRPRPPVIVDPGRPIAPPPSLGIATVPPSGGGRPPGGPPSSGGRGWPPGIILPIAAAAGAAVPPGPVPRAERRYVPDEILVIVRPNTTPAALAAAERRFGLTLIASDRIDLIDSSIRRYRLPQGSTVPGAVQALSRDQRIAQAQPNYIFARPNYVFRLQSAVTTPSGGASLQYVADVLQLPQAHAMAKGTRVPVAVIDSGIDASSPELAGRITKSYDAVGGAPAPHEHGTGMAGAIAATGQLVGVSPAADILAARAFGPPSQAAGASGTSFHILKALDWSAREGARIVNMSFAGPADPLLSQAIASASTRNIAFVAAMGNEGPRAPAAYPAADRNVIAVTATDQGGQIFAQANRGAHVAVAAPGVDVILPAPGGSYQVSSGTSVAAAHVSGIAALIIERAPATTPDQLRRILTDTAQRGSTPQAALGAGVAAPVPALTAAAPATAPAEATQQPKP